MRHNRKIKKTIKITLSILILALSLLFSCDDGKSMDGCSYIVFSGETNLRAKISYDLEDYDDLYWFYKAEKADGYGVTGTAEEWTPINVKDDNTLDKALGSAVIGPFSQGKWKFSLKAYKTQVNEKPTSGSDYASYSYEATTMVNGEETKTTNTLYYTDAVYETKTEVETTLIDTLETVSISVEPSGDDGVLVLDDLSFTSTSTTEIKTVLLTLTRNDSEASYTPTNTSGGSIALTSSGESGSKTYTLNFNSTAGVTLSGYETTYGLKMEKGIYSSVVKGYSGEDTTGNPVFTSKTFYIAIYGSAVTVVSETIEEAGNT